MFKLRKLGILSTCLFAGSLFAESTFVTPAGSWTSGVPVNASATFAATSNSLVITLTNLRANITDVAQGISGLAFIYSGTPGAIGLTSSSGQSITITNQQGILGNTVSTNWAGYSFSSGFIVCTVCQGYGADQGPNHLVIGSGPYTNANGSINNNPADNPFVNQTATFNLSGNFSSVSIDAVVFFFNTASGRLIHGIPTDNDNGGGGTSVVPEPGTYLTMGVALAALLARKFSRS